MGKVVWADLTTPDLAASKRFYGGLFGWTFRDIRAGEKGYSVALLEGTPVAGLFQHATPSGERRRPAWVAFVAVRDVEAVKKTALENGATVPLRTADFPAAWHPGDHFRSRRSRVRGPRVLERRPG